MNMKEHPSDPTEYACTNALVHNVPKIASHTQMTSGGGLFSVARVLKSVPSYPQRASRQHHTAIRSIA
ncbi:hypothetical protein [Nocardia sp. NPDC052566]|uniref:hypothetical protein n=1 Tax=Nocardia sp. NPDC052566 TaxID=3364330 RepID=UPI0037C62B60